MRTGATVKQNDFHSGTVAWARRTIVLLLSLALAGCVDPGRDLIEVLERVPHVWIGPLISLATLLSEDLACVTAGILASQDILTYLNAVWWCWLGILTGDMALYWVGRVFGRRATELKIIRLMLTPERLRLGEELFQRMGGALLFSSRFLPGTRVPAYVAAGILRFPAHRFALCLGLAGLLWTPVVVGFAMLIGSRLLAWLALYERYAAIGVAVAIGLTWLAVRWIEPMLSYRGRHLLLARFHRLIEPEFWPSWAYYLPIGFRLIRAAMKHEGWTTFTVANPAIPHSGLALESKSEILLGLTGGTGADERVARWAVLTPERPPEARFAELEAFLVREGLSYPVALKPDIGERGQGVAIVRDAAEARAYIEAFPLPMGLIAQEFVPGIEYGVFYVRHPNEERGRLISITRKHTVAVEGDGRRTLEELILEHPRGLRGAPYFLERHAERLRWIPAPGEAVALGDLGTHCRGAIFTDARDCATEELLTTIDSLSKRFEGFYFGRFDLKVPDEAALREGRDIRVLELNGVSSEPTHIYQPGYPIWRAWGDLAEQWELAFEIGGANRERGHRPSSVRAIQRLLWRYYQRDVYEAACESAKTAPES